MYLKLSIAQYEESDYLTAVLILPLNIKV